MTRATNKPLKVVIALLEYVDKKLQTQSVDDTVVFTEADIKNISPLATKAGIETAIKKIDGENEIRAYTEVAEEMAKTAVPAEYAPVKVWRCTVHVGDEGLLKNLIKEKKEKLSEVENSACLVYDQQRGLYYEEKQGDDKSYKPTPGKLPYKLLDVLSREDDFISTQALSGHIGEPPQRVRRLIADLRDALSEHLGYPKETFIETSEDGLGYRIKNSKIE